MPDATPPPKPIVLGTVDVNGGRDRADLVRELCPDGRIVEHLRVVTSSYVDRLYADGLLSHDAREGADMRDAADRLRTDWTQAGIAVGHVASVDPGAAGAGGRRFDDLRVQDEAAYGRYVHALASLSPMDAHIARRAVVSEQPVMLEPLRSALAGLVRHYGRGEL